MSDDWNQHWKSYARSNELNPAQAYRQHLIFTALDLERAPSPVRLLDLGCGSGELLLEASRRRPDIEVVGLDLADEACRQAQSKLPTGRFFARNFASNLELPKELDGWATHAVCTEVLEHLDDPSAALRNVRRLFATGARLVVTVPGGPMSAFDKHIGHRGHFTRERLSSVLEGGGLQPERVDGAGLPFFNLYRLTVVARGKKLIDDVNGGSSTELPLTARLAMRALGELFRFNRGQGKRGWQLVGLARNNVSLG